MTPDLALRQEANWLYQSIKASNPSKAPEALIRVQTFVPRLVPEGQRSMRLQCPRCWVANGQRSSLTAIPSDSTDYDLARCDSCRTEIVLPI